MRFAEEGRHLRMTNSRILRSCRNALKLWKCSSLAFFDTGPLRSAPKCRRGSSLVARAGDPKHTCLASACEPSTRADRGDCTSRWRRCCEEPRNLPASGSLPNPVLRGRPRTEGADSGPLCGGRRDPRHRARGLASQRKTCGTVRTGPGPAGGPAHLPVQDPRSQDRPRRPKLSRAPAQRCFIGRHQANVCPKPSTGFNRLGCQLLD